MKILMITDNHTPTGGAEKYFFELKNKLIQQDLTVFSFGFSNKAQKGRDFLTLAKTKNKFIQFIYNIMINRFVYRELSTLLATFKPDIIHLHNNKQYSASVFKALKPYKVVQTVHDYGYICPIGYNTHRDLTACGQGFSWKCIFQHWLKYSLPIYLANILLFYRQRQNAHKTIQHFIAPSPLLRQYLANCFAKPVSYIPHFKLELSAFDCIKRQDTLDEKIFLFVGNFGIHKGINLLLREFAASLKEILHTNPKLILIGQGPLKKNIESFIRENKLTNYIKVYPWQSNLRSYYQKAYAVIFPSICQETFGLVITEAMAYAKPVIGSNLGSIPWLVADEQTGCLFNPHKPGDLTKKIIYMAKNPIFAHQMGLKGQQFLAERFDNTHTMQQIVSVYIQARTI